MPRRDPPQIASPWSPGSSVAAAARSPWSGIVVAIYLAFRGASSLAGVLLDRWWLHSVTDVPIWSTITWAPLCSWPRWPAIVSAVILGGTLWMVARRGEAPLDDVGGIVRRYRDRMGPAHRWLLIAVVVFITVRIAAAANSHWQEWLLFRHGDDLDRSVPELGGDLGYYLFKLPLLSVVSTWVRQVLLVAIGLAAFASWITGGIRLPGTAGDRSPRRSPTSACSARSSPPRRRSTTSSSGVPAWPRTGRAASSARATPSCDVGRPGTWILADRRRRRRLPARLVGRATDRWRAVRSSPSERGACSTSCS